jgi:hypothetical protein
VFKSTPLSLLADLSPGESLFTSCREEEFSETHLQYFEMLCAAASKTYYLQPYRHTTIPQDVVVLDEYAGRRLAPPRS